jgi:hypothetical protein
MSVVYAPEFVSNNQANNENDHYDTTWKHGTEWKNAYVHMCRTGVQSTMPPETSHPMKVRVVCSGGNMLNKLQSPCAFQLLHIYA